MQNKEEKTINIRLNSIEVLFEEPDFNPFDPESRDRSGMDELMDQLRESYLKRPLKINLGLPPESEDSVKEKAVKIAIDRYCSVKIRGCEQEIYDVISQGKQDLLSALLFSLLLFLGAFFVTQLSFLPEFIIYLIATGFGIIAWVVLWPPLDNLLYEWKPCRHMQRKYKYIQSAELEINTIVEE